MITGVAPFGSYPFGGLFLTDEEQGRERLIYAKKTVYFASKTFATEPGDTPESTQVTGRFKPFAYRSEIGTEQVKASDGLGSGIGRFAGASPLGFGDVELENVDGALDGLVQRTVTDGARVRIKVGKTIEDIYGRRRVIPYKDFTQILEATAEQWTAGDRNPRLKLRDATVRLERPVQPTTYGGSGGQSGTLDLAGQTLPIAYGHCINVTPTLVDPVKWIYQFNDLSSDGVEVVRDKGVRLDFGGDTSNYAALEAAILEPGTYATCLFRGGFIRLGNQPSGLVTADVRGSKEARRRGFFTDGSAFTDLSGFANVANDSYVDSTAAIISRLLTDRNVIRPAEIETSSFSGVERDQPAAIGYYIPSGRTVTLIQAVDELARGAGCWFGQGLDGRFVLMRFEVPASGKVPEYSDRQIVNMRKADLPYRAPPYSWQVTARRNWTPVTNADLAEGTNADDLQLLTRDVSIAASYDRGISRAFRSSKAVRIEAFFDGYTAAAAEAERLADVYSVDRAVYELELPLLAARRVRGETIRVTYNHPGFTAGKNVVIIGTDINIAQSRVILTVFG